MRRPALLSLSLYALGVFLDRVLQIPLFYLSILLGSLFLGLLILLAIWKEKPSTWLLVPAIILTGSLTYHISARWQPPHSITHYLDKDILLRGRVLDEPDQSLGSTSFRCAAQAVVHPGQATGVSGRILVRCGKPGGRVEYGDVVELRGRLISPSASRNPRAFNYREYLFQRGIYGILRVGANGLRVIAKGSGNPFLAKVIHPVKRHVRESIDKTLRGDQGGLLKGLLLGERRAISREVKEVFSNAGVIHVLAVSGLHVGIVLSILLLLFRLLRIPFRISLMCVAALLPLYAFITGLRPSVVRATVMAVCLLVGWMLERETDPLNVLGFAGLLILFFNPRSLFDTGFQLSFAATASILYLYPKLHPLLFGWLGKSTTWLKWATSSLAVSLCAQLGVIPLVAYHFFRVPVLPIFANLIVVPLIGVAISLGIASSLASLISQGLARIFAASNWLVLTSTLKTVGLLNSLPFASLRVGRPSIIHICLYFPVLFGLANWKSKLWARWVVLLSVLIGVGFATWPRIFSERRVEATFLDVGKGESCLLKFPNGKNMLIDGGGRSRNFDAGRDVIAPFLWAHGVKRIDLVALSNSHNDHSGGLLYIMENFPVGLVVEAGVQHDSWSYRRFLELVEEKSIPYRVVRKGDVIEELGLPISVLHPPEGVGRPGSDLREQSLVLRFTYGEVTFLFTGDYGGSALEGEIDVLKIPNYGALKSNPPDLVERLSPQIAVVSKGRSRLPREEVLKSYSRMGTETYPIDRDGAVMLKTDGKYIQVRTMSPDLGVRRQG